MRAFSVHASTRSTLIPLGLSLGILVALKINIYRNSSDIDSEATDSTKLLESQPSLLEYTVVFLSCYAFSERPAG
jgi:hypothetical protein